MACRHTYADDTHAGLRFLSSCVSRWLFIDLWVCRRCFQLDEVENVVTELLRQNRTSVVRVWSTSASTDVQRTVSRSHSCWPSEVRSSVFHTTCPFAIWVLILICWCEPMFNMDRSTSTHHTTMLCRYVNSSRLVARCRLTRYLLQYIDPLDRVADLPGRRALRSSARH